ncbi:MAG: hypothetical protein J2P15_12925 [Micromonosporaceae bacterium]|nr:hypothetical protein [Micromonosporaceae bacterium]
MEISVFVSPPASTTVLAQVRALTGLGYLDIRGRITGTRPVLTARLFGNDHEEVAATLRRLLALPAPTGVWCEEVDEDGGRPIEREAVLSILDEHERLLRRYLEPE